jgi:hypothetical protein
MKSCIMVAICQPMIQEESVELTLFSSVKYVPNCLRIDTSMHRPLAPLRPQFPDKSGAHLEGFLAIDRKHFLPYLCLLLGIKTRCVYFRIILKLIGIVTAECFQGSQDHLHQHFIGNDMFVKAALSRHFFSGPKCVDEGCLDLSGQ